MSKVPTGYVPPRRRQFLRHLWCERFGGDRHVFRNHVCVVCGQHVAKIMIRDLMSLSGGRTHD